MKKTKTKNKKVRPFREFDTVAHPFGEFDFNAFVAGVRVDPS